MTRDSKSRGISRRLFVGSTGALALAGSLPVVPGVSAQDATPMASPVATPAGSALNPAEWGTFG